VRALRHGVASGTRTNRGGGDAQAAHVPGTNNTKNSSTGWRPATVPTDRWQPGCACENNTGAGRCIVLDPFVGTGTTVAVAHELGRDAIGIDLHPRHTATAERRVERTQPAFHAILDEAV
jgi:hypothetical protein